MLPVLANASTHIINQTYFLNNKPVKFWKNNDQVIVLGDQRVDIAKIARARKSFPRSMPIYWLLSDEQWYYNNIGLNKDQKVIDFAKQMEELYIHVVSENLCPKPTIFHEKTHDIMVVDSSWFLFEHKTEFFRQKCPDIDLGRFYTDIEETMLNAKLKPLVIVTYHGVHPDLIGKQNNFADQIQQSIGSMNQISNPAYQTYQERINKYIRNRNNLLVVSSSKNMFFRDSNDSRHSIGMQTVVPDELFLQEIPEGLKIFSKSLPEPIQIVYNEAQVADEAACRQHRGPLYNFKIRGNFMEYFLGENYRKQWTDPLASDCFDLVAEGYRIEKIGGSLRSPDFLLKDRQGRTFQLRPLKKEIRIPDILRETIVENVLLDQQSSINPIGFLLAASLARVMGMPTEAPRLVYIDINQKSFLPWKEKEFPSGYYQLVHEPQNLMKNPESRNIGLLEVVNTQEMVERLENGFGYTLDQAAYLKARLFDIMIGDWDRPKENWYWMVIQKETGKTIVPFPIDRETAFYTGDGVVSWWRKRKWINYKLQRYGEKLKRPEPMMIQSLSMDHRFTFALTKEDWDRIVNEVQQRMTPEALQQAIAALPVQMLPKDQEWLTKAFKKRSEELPRVAYQMRSFLRQSVDIVGSSGKDVFFIQSGPGSQMHVAQKRDNQIVFKEEYDSKLTKEIRIYGLNGDDDYRLNWKNYSPTKVRLIPGNGNDMINTFNEKVKPKVYLYDDDVSVKSLHGFTPNSYQPIYNDYYSQVNQRKLNLLSPVLFLASKNTDSGFVLGGGVRYFKEGFQREPWQSTNEIKANAAVDRAALNVLYIGTWFDFFGASDFQTEIDVGVPRFSGSFFGIGNATPNLDPTKPEDYYWMKSRHLEALSKITIPIFQHISLIPQVQFRFRQYVIENTSFLNNPAENNLDAKLSPGSNANIDNLNYYLGAGAAFDYRSDDAISGPVKKRTIRAQARWMFQQGLAKEDPRFQTLDVNGGLTGFFRKSKTQWKVNFGFGQNFGDWEFFDAQFLGQGQNLRGFFLNRFAGSSRLYDSIEINQSLLFKKTPIITDYGLGGFFDHGRVFFSSDPNADLWHKGVGAQAWVTLLNSVAFKVAYSHAIMDRQKQEPLWSFVLTTEL